MQSKNTVQIFGHSIISSQIVKLFRKKKTHENEILFIISFFFPIDVVMDMKVHFVINVSDILDANMANVMNLGLAIAKKVGVVYFATKI